MAIYEDHLRQIQHILDSDSGMFQKLEQIGAYLVKTQDLAAVGIFRRVGDEFDDHIFVTAQEFRASAAYRLASQSEYIEHFPIPLQIVKSRYIKPRLYRTSHEQIPEILVPIVHFHQTVGLLHAEKRLGGRFSGGEIQLLRDTAHLLGRLFTPSVVHVN